MKKVRKSCFALTCAAAALATPWITSCGKGIFDTKTRQNTTAALLADAMDLYDAGKYADAASNYREVLAKDPHHVGASVGLAFSLHGQAGKSIVDIIGNLIAQNGAAKAENRNLEMKHVVQAVGFQTSSSDPAAASELKQLTDIKNLVTLQEHDKWTVANLRTHSQLLSTFHESWLALCRVMPATTLAKLKEWTTEDAAKTATRTPVFDLAQCGAGIDQSSSAVFFAAALNTMTQVAALYQSVLNVDYATETGSSPTFGLMDSANEIKSDLDSLDSLTDSGAYMSTLTNTMHSLKETALKVDSEIMEKTFGQLELLTTLVAALPGIPESAIASIEKIQDQLESLTSQIAALKVDDPDSTDQEAQKMQAVREKAQEAAPKANEKIAERWVEIQSGTEEEKTEFLTKRDTMCSDFESVKVIMNLDPTTKVPCTCLYQDANPTEAYGCCAKEVDVAAQATCCDGVAAGRDSEATVAANCKAVPLNPAFLQLKSIESAARAVEAQPHQISIDPEAIKTLYLAAEAEWRAEIEREIKGE